MNTEIGKQRVVGWVLGKYCAKDLRYVLLDGHDAEVIRHDSVVSELNNQLEAQAAYSSIQFDRITELTAEVALLRDLVSVAESIFQNCDVLSGTCCCGDSMDRHDKYQVDHTPRDMGVRSVEQWLEQCFIARNALKEGV